MNLSVYLISAVIAVCAGGALLAFCPHIRRFHVFISYTLIFEGLCQILGWTVSVQEVFYLPVWLLYYATMLLIPFCYYFATRLLLREEGVRIKDFWMLQTAAVFVVFYVCLVSIIPDMDKDIFVTVLSSGFIPSGGLTLGLSSMITLDNIGSALFVFEQLFVLLFCFINLRRYQKMIQEYYADFSNKSLYKLLVLFIIVSIRFVVFLCADIFAASACGRVLSVLQNICNPLFYGAVLFFVFNIQYSAEELGRLISSQNNRKQAPSADDLIASKLDGLVNSRFYISPDTNLVDVASLIQINSKYLSEYLKYHFDETFMVFVNRLRIEYAVELMEDTDFSLNDISEKVGYGNVSTFYRNFSKFKGVSPSDYRKKK